MTRAAAHHEEVPDGVVVGHIIAQVEDDADAVAQSSREEEEEAGEGEALVERDDHKDSDPSHREVKQRFEQVVTVRHEDLERDPCDGDRPDDRQKPPAPRAFEREDGKGGIAARDQEIDADVIDKLPHTLALGKDVAVVQRRRGVHQDHRCTKDRAAKEGEKMSLAKRPDRHHQKADEAQHQAHRMGQAVDAFFFG